MTRIISWLFQLVSIYHKKHTCIVDFITIFPTLDSVTGSAVYNVVMDEAGDVSLTPSVTVSAYNNYTVSVQAFTGAGGGETVDTIVLSPQAGINIIVETLVRTP